MVQKSLFLAISGMAGVGVVWPSTRSGQRELDSVKTDLIAVERNLVSGNKLHEEYNQLKILIHVVILIINIYNNCYNV